MGSVQRVPGPAAQLVLGADHTRLPAAPWGPFNGFPGRRRNSFSALITLASRRRPGVRSTGSRGRQRDSISALITLAPRRRPGVLVLGADHTRPPAAPWGPFNGFPGRRRNSISALITLASRRRRRGPQRVPGPAAPRSRRITLASRAGSVQRVPGPAAQLVLGADHTRLPAAPWGPFNGATRSISALITLASWPCHRTG